MQLVGVLLISALFVLPNVSAMLYARSFKQTVILSMSFAVFATVSGIIMSYQFEIAQAGCIVLVAAAIFWLACCKGFRAGEDCWDSGEVKLIKNRA